MKAVVTRGTEQSTVEDVPRPTPGPDEVVLAVRRVQLSVTDCWYWRGDLQMPPAMRERIDDGDGLVLGHEFCGVVDEVGANVTEYAVGDRVYAPGKITCGECAYCEHDWPLLCEHAATLGLGEYPGALAEYVAIPTEPLCAVPDAVSDAEVAALQPLADAMLTVHDAGIETGDVVAVVGAGVMGAQCGQIARYLGAGEVFAVDVDPAKIRLAESWGLTGVDATAGDPVEQVTDLTDGVGADVVFEAVGGNQSDYTDGGEPAAQAFHMLRPGGTLVQVGLLSGKMTFTPLDLRLKAVTVRNPISAKGVLSTGPNSDTGVLAAEMVADGRVSIEPFVTHELDGLEAVTEAIDITANKAEYDALGPAQIVVSE